MKQSLDDLTFDITKNELNFTEQQMIFDIQANLKFSEDDELRKLVFTNQSLLAMFENKHMNYEEEQAARYDPIKPRVMGALSSALTQSNL